MCLSTTGMPSEPMRGNSYNVTGCVVSAISDCSLQLNITVYICEELQVYKVQNSIEESAYCLGMFVYVTCEIQGVNSNPPMQLVC